MPMFGIKQPEMIEVDENIRLKRYYNDFDFALPWYKDEETVRLLSGEGLGVYTKEEMYIMYKYLNLKGELYIIEYLEDGVFEPIGDVTLMRNDLPIVIGEEKYRNKGVGKRVLKALIERAKNLNLRTLGVKEVFFYNIGSNSLFKSVGFKVIKETKKGYAYKLDLK